jgi:hypothetical protein
VRHSLLLSQISCSNICNSQSLFQAPTEEFWKFEAFESTSLNLQSSSNRNSAVLNPLDRRFSVCPHTCTSLTRSQTKKDARDSQCNILWLVGMCVASNLRCLITNFLVALTQPFWNASLILLGWLFRLLIRGVVSPQETGKRGC